MLVSLNPDTGIKWAEFQPSSPHEIEAALVRAKTCFQEWRRTDLPKRSALLYRIADLLEMEKDELAAMATREMGKPLAQSLAEVEKSARALRYFADEAETILKDQPVETGDGKQYVHFQPLGTILAIMPWNFPYWQVFRAMGAILVSGNTMVLKHASNVSGSASAIADILRKSEAPSGLFELLLLPSSQVEALIQRPEIQAVSFTGSTLAGAQVAAIAASQIKKQVLELGGSDPYLILEDADLDLAVRHCVESRLVNNGQSCVAAKRFIVHQSLVREFEERMVAQMKQVSWGNPMDSKYRLGPLARQDIRDEVGLQVDRSIKAGARLLLGGAVPKGEGFYYPPTVLSGVTPGMAAFDEEVFGPVAAIIPAASEAEAIELANRSSYGLGAGIFSRDIDRAERIAREEIEAGSCFVNAAVHSDPRLPFGGIKSSGYGRELSGYGVREFTNIKTISLV